MTKARLAVACAASFLLFGCTHVVGFHPVKVPSKVQPKTAASVRLYMAPEIESATYSFRAARAGRANKWVVRYGARVHDFAVAYLGAAFTDFQEVSSPQVPAGPDVLVTIDNVDYYMSGQAAHVQMDVEVRDASGRVILSKHYATRGWSGYGVVLIGRAWAEKGVTRSSTDEALKEIFSSLVKDLRGALAARSARSGPGAPEAGRASPTWSTAATPAH